MEHVPTIALDDPSSTELDALDTACRDHGFFLLTGHGCDDVIDRTWTATRAFFAAPPSVKESIRRDAENPLGWFDRELTKRLRDGKEVFDFIDPSSGRDPDPNRWPPGLDDFRATMSEFFAALADVALRTTDLLHATLGLDAGTAATHTCAPNSSTVRLNHYPVDDPVPVDERADLAPRSDVALGHHTDPGVLTLLLQDDTGGLQAESATHGWIDVPPTPGTIVVNLGDTMQVWSNDRWRAAVHRVTPMRHRSRYSIPWFGNPARDTVIEPIAALATDAPRYRPFTWREFMGGRASDNFADYGTDDIQISHYAVA